MKIFFFFLAIIFSCHSSFAQKDFGFKEALTLAGMKPEAARKVLEQSGFTHLKDGPYFMGKASNGDMIFYNMETLHFVELTMEDQELSNVFFGYNGQLYNSLVTLDILSMGFEEVRFEGSDDWIEEQTAKVGKDSLEYYRLSLPKGRILHLSRMFDTSQDPMTRSYVLRFYISQQDKTSGDNKVPGDHETTGYIRKGEQFLANNKKRSTVKTTPSGLQYEILRAGKGPKPTVNDTVLVNYTLSLIDGKEIHKEKASSLPLSYLMKGWTEGLPLMNEGSRFKLYIPHHLGYGLNEAPKIPAGSVMIYHIELLKVLKAD